jgi:hypothetical protein
MKFNKGDLVKAENRVISFTDGSGNKRVKITKNDDQLYMVIGYSIRCEGKTEYGDYDVTAYFVASKTHKVVLAIPYDGQRYYKPVIFFEDDLILQREKIKFQIKQESKNG